MRLIAFILILSIVLLLTACNTQEKEINVPTDDFYLTNVMFRLEYPEEILPDEEFSVKVYVSRTNETFSAALSSITFPFSDFKFADGKESFVVYPNINILHEETKVLEYKIKRNMEANLGSGMISSLMQFELHIEDPEYGSRDLIIREDFVLEFI